MSAGGWMAALLRRAKVRVRTSVKGVVAEVRPDDGHGELQPAPRRATIAVMSVRVWPKALWTSCDMTARPECSMIGMSGSLAFA
jgi:hypothetical protein